MRKRLALALTMVLLFILAGCAGEDAPSSDPSPAADYTQFCAAYSDTTTVEGPCYTVNITRVDNATKELEFTVSYVGINSSPVYTTETIRATIVDDHTVSFAWKDSWKNQGTGTLILDPEDATRVQLLMTVTEEAEVNRATLSTHGEYKTLLRR